MKQLPISAADEYYGDDGALSKIDDLTPFIELADHMKHLADEGLINDMRRELVIAFVKHREPYLQKKYQEGELNGVKWSVAVVDDIHMKDSHAHAGDDTDKIFKGIKNQLRDRFRFVSGIDPAPNYPVDVTLESQHQDKEE